MEFGVINALAHFVTAVGASWGRSQEWLSCARVLWDWLHPARSDRTAQGNDGVAKSKRPTLQGFGLHSYLEQPVRVGGYSRFHMAA